MNDLYRDFILDHYRRPRNFGRLAEADISHEEDNPLCGDHIGLDLKIEDGRVSDVRFRGQGCAISMASASLLTETIKGERLDDLRALGKENVLENLGMESISPARLKCALLALRALRAGAFGIDGWPDEADGGRDGADWEGGGETWPPR